MNAEDDVDGMLLLADVDADVVVVVAMQDKRVLAQVVGKMMMKKAADDQRIE